ncbi:sigma-70 family RNA polymerase sigma factor [Aliikangiella marina]|uniref:Sigma-70 family RNA polymerase sigma factor n=1 Tax=Aliikangiella marina TaxID=1712262 RepID=A0A545T4W8_9GAMM|nr:sigma-70 family RNA polymerase sigma factor [Aliikangiella marina]TQV72263.1 sigma-70 family RNA polymerase sigma factor [Aliikangiella marina]
MVENNRMDRKGIADYESYISDLSLICPTQLVKQAAAGDRLSIRELIKRITPTIQVSAAQTISNYSFQNESTHTHAEIADYCQDVFMHLFDKQCKVLLSWDPQKGMSLKSFISLITKRRVISCLRSHKKTDILDEKIINEKIDTLKTPNEQHRFSNHNFLINLIRALKDTISEQGYEVFVMLFLYEQSIEEVSKSTGLSKNAIYVWKNRIRNQARSIARDWDSVNNDMSSRQHIESKREVNVK